LVRRSTRGLSSQEAILLDLIDGFYAAALAPEEWPAAFTKLTQHCGAELAIMIAFSHSHDDDAFSVTNLEADPALPALFRTKYMVPQTNPWILPMMAAGPGKIVLHAEHLPHRAWERTELYNDVVRPVRAHDALGVLLLPEERYFVGMTRLKSLGSFDTASLTLLERAIPHMRRAMQTMLRLNNQNRQAADQALWNRLPYGVFLLDERRRVIWANPSAEAILAKGEGLSARGGYLFAAAAEECTALHKIIAEAVQTGMGWGSQNGGAIAISRPSSARPLTLLVAPFRAPLTGILAAGHHPCAVIFVTDPESKIGAAADLLADIYKLTPREAALVGLLIEGYDLSTAADQLGIGMPTARTHLRLIFEKTHTHRQAELVSLLLRSVVTLRPA
jgi:DNA-binding CsgD family transcriptional regulator/PAS domain-containing protein